MKIMESFQEVQRLANGSSRENRFEGHWLPDSKNSQVSGVVSSHKPEPTMMKFRNTRE